MKKLLLLTSIFASSLFFTSCGDDDSCDAADWVGTYTLTSDPSCVLDESTTISAEESLTINAGSSDDTVSIDGQELTINSENCTITYLITVTKSGDELTTNFGGDCVFTYKKN